MITTFDKKQLIIYAGVALLAVIIAIGAYFYGVNSQKPVIMSPADVQSPQAVADKLNISQNQAKEVIREIQTVVQKEPVVTYQVQAPTTQKAAEIVQKQIETNTTPVKLPSADKTIVTPQEQKVDVYRINLDKKWEVGAGAIYKNGLSPVGSIQYNSGSMGYEVIVGQDTAGGMVKVRF